jgi:O-antigen/teichoic acid export membrane protein
VSIRKAVFDTAAMSSVTVMRMLAQFMAIPILARFLSPADYGLVGMAMPFVFFAMMIADAGIGMSLVRTDLNQRHEWSTCFWLSVMLGGVLAAIMLCSVPLAATMLKEPRLQPIAMALISVVVIQSVGSIPGAALQQQHKFMLIALVEIIATALSIAIAVVAATHGCGAWALVFQQVGFYGVRVVLTFWFSAFRPQLFFDLRRVTEHLLFGRDVLSSNLINFFTRSMDNLVIGKVLGAAPVGVYSMAFQFARLPNTLVSGPLQFVLYARLARVKNQQMLIRTTFLALTRILASLIFPSMGMVAAAYHPVFTLLLTTKWAAAGKLFMLVAPACAVQSATALCATIMLVLGRTDIRLRVVVESGIMWIVMLCAAVWFGIEWTGIAFDLSVVIYTPRLLMMTLPLIACPAGDYIRAITTPVIVTLGCIGGFLSLQYALDFGDVAELALAAVFTVVGVAASALAQRRPLMSALGEVNPTFDPPGAKYSEAADL